MQDDGLGCVGPTARSLPWLLLGAIRVIIVLHDVTAVAVVGLVVRSGLSRIIYKHKSQSLWCEQQGFHGSHPVTWITATGALTHNTYVLLGWLRSRTICPRALKIYPAECKKWQQGMKRETILKTIV